MPLCSASGGNIDWELAKGRDVSGWLGAQRAKERRVIGTEKHVGH